MTGCWFDVLAAPADGASAQARAFASDGTPAGWLAVWLRRAKPSRSARRIDARLVDRHGAAAWVSLVRPPAGVRLAFDDLAVQQARRAVLAAPPQDALSTLLSDASHFEGALTVARGAGVARLADDPFARIFPAESYLGRHRDDRGERLPHCADDFGNRARGSQKGGTA